MKNRYIKYLQHPLENIDLSSSDTNSHNLISGAKWLPYVLMATAMILWVVFNIVAIQSNQFTPYPLVGINLILYCIIAVAMANRDQYDETKKR